MFRWIKGIVGILFLTSIVACGNSEKHTNNIVEATQADSRFTFLNEAIQTAGLTETLSGPDTYTLFAPTNDAFKALLAELGITEDQLLSNQALLTAVLNYHVVPGSVSSAQIPLGKAITPVAGGIFKVDKTGADLIINDGRNRKSKIVQADIPAANGLIHAIDKVLLPADKTILQTAAANPDFSILVEAVNAAGLTGTLGGTAPLTVFAPTNAAFASLFAELGVTKDQLFADKVLLTKVLIYHVLPGLVLKADLPFNTPIKTFEGETFTVSQAFAITDQRGRVANITATDILATNGAIHVVDKVILPAP
jgi:uncharacterized surface protein with fasciclin (FAS1) repeats